MATDDVVERLAAVESVMRGLAAVFDVPATETEVAALEHQASAPDLWDDQENAQRVTSRLAYLQGELRDFTALTSRVADVPVMFDLADAEGDESARAEALEELASLERDLNDAEVRTLL